MTIQVRAGKAEEASKLRDLFIQVAKTEGGLARTESEISSEYMQFCVDQSLKHGAWWVAEDESGLLMGSVHAYRPFPQVFNHVLSELTIAVHPEAQGKKVGKELMNKLLAELPEGITRVELIVRESNKKAILFYDSLGFNIEGRLEDRIHSVGGGFEADIPMAWLKK